MDDRTRNSRPNAVGSVDTMFDIVEYVGQSGGVTLGEAATDLDYAKSTIHRHLSTLERRGYVVREDGYYVGLRFLELGELTRNRRPAFQLAKEKVEELADTTDERAQFIVEEQSEAVYLHRALGDHAVHTDPGIGKRIPLHATSAGKAILAALPAQELSRIIEQTSFDEITDETITNTDDLHAELEEIRERGFAFNRQENLRGLHAVGVSVTGQDGFVIGALSVSGPSHRLTGDWFSEDLPSLLLGTANELELNIAHS